MSRIYVGNLSYDTNEGALQQLFAQYGTVTEVKVVTDGETGRSRGFAFVEMGDSNQAKAAIEALEGKEFDGRNLRVNEARPRSPRDGGSRRQQY